MVILFLVMEKETICLGADEHIILIHVNTRASRLNKIVILLAKHEEREADIRFRTV